MADNPATAIVTARLRFDGVMLMCINKNKNNRAEVGFLLCPEHKPEIVIQVPTGTGTVTESPIIVTDDLYFEVVKPKTAGVHPRPEAGDDFDFHFIPDIEGSKLHNDKVTVNTNKFWARLAITAGLIYSHDLFPEPYDLVKWVKDDDPGTKLKRFDRIANNPGLNIDCVNEDGGVAIINTATGKTIRFLQHLPGKTYTITIKNDCSKKRVPVDPSKTDFRLYYKVVEAKDKLKLDFKEVVVKAPSPRICELAFLSRTDTLGFSFEPGAKRISENNQDYASPPKG